jgi:hypothetical protein
MVCQYSICAPVSSGKHDRALDSGAVEGGGGAFDTGTVIVGRSCALSESHTALTRQAHATHLWSARTCGRWSVAHTLLDRLAPDRHEVTRAYRLSWGSRPLG